VLALAAVPLFHHSDDEHAAPVLPELDAELQRLVALPMAELAAEALQLGFSDQAPLPEGKQVKYGRAAVMVDDVTLRYIEAHHPLLGTRLELVKAYMREAFGALLAARLVTHAFSPSLEGLSTSAVLSLILTREGRAALDRADAAEVLARRLPN
jgi:hypothetical protein